jgi:hypothetical protein
MRDEFAAELPFPDGLQLLIDETLRTLPLSFHVSHADQNMIEDAERREQHLKKTGPILFDVPIDTPERTTYSESPGSAAEKYPVRFKSRRRNHRYRHSLCGGHLTGYALASHDVRLLRAPD